MSEQQQSLAGADVDPVAVSVGRLDDAALRQMMGALSAAEFPFMAAHSPADAYMGGLLPQFDPAAYEDGRAFGPGGDLRWRREEWLTGGELARGWRVVFVGPRARCPLPLDSAESLPLDKHVQRRVTARLWGERRGDEPLWTEARIPRAFDYGAFVAGRPRRVGVVVIQYILSGQVDFTRFLGFDRWPAAEVQDA